MPQSASQFSGIFISYRRDDSAGHAGRLFDRLAAHFGDEQIFMDIDQIEPGEDFVRVIEGAVGSCEILVALIGRSWLTSRDEAGRRLDNPNDFVRLEVAAALARGVRVIPVLVQGAQMPRPQDLPEDLLPLARRHALELSDLRWNHDVEQLIGALEKILARQREAQRIAEEEEAERQRLEAEAQRQAEESERLKRAAAEAEHQKQEAEEAERRRREAKARRQAEAQQQAEESERLIQAAAEAELRRREAEEAEGLRRLADEHTRSRAAERKREQQGNEKPKATFVKPSPDSLYESEAVIETNKLGLLIFVIAALLIFTVIGLIKLASR